MNMVNAQFTRVDQQIVGGSAPAIPSAETLTGNLNGNAAADNGSSTTLIAGTTQTAVMAPVQIAAESPLAKEWEQSLVPHELRLLNRWTSFLLSFNKEKGKYDKVPLKWRGRAQSTNPQSWSSWSGILQMANKHGDKKLAPAFALSADDDIGVIDLDHVINANGQWNPVAAKLVDKFKTYAEFSVSGDGLHLFFRGQTTLNGNETIVVDGKELDIEIYNKSRFICMTGNCPPVAGSDQVCTEIADCTEGLEWLGEVAVKKRKPVVAPRISTKTSDVKVELSALGIDHEEAGVIADLLTVIPATNYDPWWKVGMDCVRWGEDRMDDPSVLMALFDDWSQTAPEKYDADSNLEAWGNWEEKVISEELEFDPLESLKRIGLQYGWDASCGKSGLPRVIVSAQSSTVVTGAAKVVGAEFRNTNRIFLREREVVEVFEKNRRLTLYPVTSSRMVSLIEEVAAPHTEKTDKDGGTELVPCKVPDGLGGHLLSCPAMYTQLPEIKLVTNCPVLTTDETGEIVEIHGGQYANDVLAGGLPTSMPSSISEARERLDFLLADYRFEAENDKARAVASLITPALVFGGLLEGRAVLDITEADRPGAGKSYRNDILGALYSEQIAVVAQKGSGVGGAEEAVDTALQNGLSMISLDNTRGKIDSQKLETLLSSEMYAARAAYSKTTQLDPSKTIIMLTSNRAVLTPDLLRRSSIVKILKRDDYVYREFPSGDLVSHVRANSSYFLGAVHFVIREWGRRGRHCPKDTRHSFRRWVGVLGYITKDILGYADLMDGYDAIEKRMDSKEMTWLRDVLGKLAPVLDPGTKYTTSQLIDELLDTHPELIPGYSDQLDPYECKETKDKLNRAMGRRLKVAMNKGSEICVDGRKLVIGEIQVPRDDGKGNRDCKAYQLTQLT